MNLASQSDSLYPGDTAARSADKAIRETQSAANSAMDKLVGGAQDLRDRVAPVLDRAADTSSEYAHRGLDAVREGGRQLRDSARRASDGTLTYVREEPMKSLLIAVAVGAVVALLMGRRSRD